MIVINDIMAYMFGFFFGKTPLIKLSPKKTWEGFIGGGISTVILGLVVMIHLYFFLLYDVNVFQIKKLEIYVSDIVHHVSVPLLCLSH